MKKMLLFPLLMALTILVTAQTNPNLIDFEPSTANLNGCGTYTQAEYAAVDNTYFQCAYGISFHMNSVTGSPPIIGKVGAPTVGWVVGSMGAYNSANCTVSASVTSDKPSNNKDIGCFFLTDSNPGTGKNPDPLYVDYHNLTCTEASGYLVDVDGDGTTDVQEGWKITAFGVSGGTDIVYVLSPNFSAYVNPIPSPKINTNGGDGIAAEWYVDLGTEAIDYIAFEYIGHPDRGVGIAFDEFSICSSEPPVVETRGCCDDIQMQNLIPNGSFESGNVGITSNYTYQPTIAANSLTSGQYTVATGSQAGTISSCWDITDHTNCDAGGHVMLINGRTEKATNTMVYKQTNIPVEAGEPYMFCMYYRQLSQCAFDAFDPSNISFVFNSATVISSDCDDDEDHCGWTKVAYTVIPDNSTLTIKILLDQTDIGDGNDVAFDDISLRKKAEMPSGQCDFEVMTQIEGPMMTVTATATQPVPPGFTVTWIVEEVDCITGMPIPGTEVSFTGEPDITHFPWHPPFDANKCYRIRRVVSSCCYLDCEYEVSIGGEGPPQNIQGAAKPDGDTDNDVIGNNINDFKIFPNPGDGHVTINATQSLKGAALTVYSTDGKVVLEQKIQNTHVVSIDLSKLPNGMYSFKVTQTNGEVLNRNYLKQ